MRLAITNTVVLNGGDAAIMLSLESAIRRVAPDATVEIYEAQPDVARRHYPELDFRQPMAHLMRNRLRFRGARRLGSLRRWERQFHARRILASVSPGARRRAKILLSRTERGMLEDIADIDVIVSTGGTYLVEQYPLEERLFEFRLANALGIPLIFFTQSLGPFMLRHNQELLRPIFDTAALVLLRDQRSAEHLKDLGVTNGAVHVVSDAVFAMTPPDVKFSDRHDGDMPWRIGVSVRAWPPGAAQDHPEVERFVRAIAHGLNELLRTLPVEIIFISTCQGIDEYRIDDSKIAEIIVAALDSDVRELAMVDRSFHDPRELQHITKKFDFMIATRMHAGILGLSAGTPVLPIAYEFKTTELFTALGLDDYILNIGHVAGEELVANVLRFVTNLDEIRANLQRGVHSELANAELGVKLLAGTLNRIARDKAPG